jgi:hypothetical protein
MRPVTGEAVTSQPRVWVMLPADRRAAAVALLALLAARAAVGPAGSGAADDLIFGIAKMDETK